MGNDGKKETVDQRAARLAEALRANLHRRKSQTRERKAADTSARKTEKPATRD